MPELALSQGSFSPKTAEIGFSSLYFSQNRGFLMFLLEPATRSVKTTVPIDFFFLESHGRAISFFFLVSFLSFFFLLAVFAPFWDGEL